MSIWKSNGQKDTRIPSGQLKNHYVQFRTWGHLRDIRIKAHMSHERDTETHEIVPLLASRGNRNYVLLRPYILLPDIRLTVALMAQYGPQQAIVQVISASLMGACGHWIGSGQARYYPADHFLVPWELLLQDR